MWAEAQRGAAYRSAPPRPPHSSELEEGLQLTAQKLRERREGRRRKGSSASLQHVRNCHSSAWRKELVGHSCQGTTPERHLGQPSNKHSTRGQGQDRRSSVYWARGLGQHFPGDGGGGQPPERGFQLDLGPWSPRRL